MSHRISEFVVTRFRGLRDLSLQGVGRINLLVGENNSGKTSVLEALSLAATPLDPWEWMNVAARREPQRLAVRTTVERLRWLFPQRASDGPGSSYDGNIELAIHRPSHRQGVEARYQDLRSALEQVQPPLSLSSTSAPEGPSDDEADLQVERRGARIDVRLSSESSREATGAASFTWEGERFQSPRQAPTGRPVGVITPYDHLFRALPARMYSEARRDGLTGTVTELLSAIDPRISGMEVLAARWPGRQVAAEAVLYLRDRDAGLLPVEAFGDGMRRILLMALAIGRARGGMLLIDEIETAIHVSALGRVFRWIVETCATCDVQLFATTHSVEAIDAILAADTTPEEDIVGYRLGTTNGRVVAQRYGESLLRRLRVERGADVR
jgi:hypothetical protein